MNVQDIESLYKRKFPHNCNHCANYDILQNKCLYFNYEVKQYEGNKMGRKPSRPCRKNKCIHWSMDKPVKKFKDMHRFQLLFYNMLLIRRKYLLFRQIQQILGISKFNTVRILKKWRSMGLLRVVAFIALRKNYSYKYYIADDIREILLAKIDKMPIRVVKVADAFR